MPLVFGCIVPHGDMIPDASGASHAPATDQAMTEIGRRMQAANPDIVVVITPHGIRADGAFAVSFSERVAGTLEGTVVQTESSKPVGVDMAVDQEFARRLQTAAKEQDIQVVGVHYGATSGPHDSYPLDWGGVVPLWYMGARFPTPPRVVIAVPSRLLGLDGMVRFGRAIANTAAASDMRVALIASSDMAHAHQADGPYGYHPAAKEFDTWIAQAIQDGDLSRLEHPDMTMVENAKPDGLWQSLVLAGALQRAPMKGEFMSYELPSYYGMLTAAYAPA